MLRTCQTSLHHELHAPHAPPVHDNAAANTVTPLPADREAGLFGKRQWPWHKHLHGAPLTRFTADGNRCQLPFKYKGRMYHDCTPEPSARCPLTPPGANAVTDDELDGVCAPNYNFAALKANFENEVYTRIGLAKDGRMGVGVVAVRDIPKDKEPFQLPDGQSCGVGEYVHFPASALKHIPKGVVAMMMDFYAVEPDGAQLVPVTGLNAMTTSYYLNHAPGGSANMQPRKCNCPIMCFYSTRDIKAGEELVFDYENAFGNGALKQGGFDSGII